MRLQLQSPIFEQIKIVPTYLLKVYCPKYLNLLINKYVHNLLIIQYFHIIDYQRKDFLLLS